jgi:hypothetical protein
MITKVHHSRKNDVQTEIVRVVKLCVTDVYIKVTEKSLTMSAPTVVGDSRTYQLAWYLVTQIVYGNHPVAK